jgi:hypothetical protein
VRRGLRTFRSWNWTEAIIDRLSINGKIQTVDRGVSGSRIIAEFGCENCVSMMIRPAFAEEAFHLRHFTMVGFDLKPRPAANRMSVSSES